MDLLDKVLMIQIYEHYIKHLQTQPNDTRAVVDDTLQIKSVTLFVNKFSSCMTNAVLMYIDADNTTNTATCTNSDFYTKNENMNEMPWIKYTFPHSSTVSLRKIVVRRPLCTDMKDAYVQCRNSTDTVVYVSNAITENNCSSTYTFHLSNVIPVIENNNNTI